MSVPILLITFTRLETTLSVLDAIREYRPKKLYISSDYGREGKFLEKYNLYEQEWITKIRKILLNNVDWDCEVKTLFFNQNMGCKMAVSTAVDWFFKNEECGIILEDDTIPSQSFFSFCESMLEQYKFSQNIFMISGWSALDFNIQAKNKLEEDYFFSKHTHIWGWASWRRAWKFYTLDLEDLDNDFSHFVFSDKNEKRRWYRAFKAYKNGQIDTWDYAWTYAIWKNKGFAIYPKNNMIKNVGLGSDDATHTKEKSIFQNMKIYNLSHSIKHPKKICPNSYLDRVCSNILQLDNKPSFKKRVQKIINAFFLHLPFSLADRHKCLIDKSISISQNIFPSQTFECNGGTENYAFTDVFGKNHSFFRPYTSKTQNFIVDIFPLGICFTDQELILDERKRIFKEYTSFKQHPFTFPNFSLHSIFSIASFLKKNIKLFIRIVRRKKIKGNIAIASRFTVENTYGHLIIDVAINIIQIQKFAQKNNIFIDYFILPTKYSFHREIAQIFNIPKERIISSSDIHMCIQADNLIVPTLSKDYVSTECRGYTTAHLQTLPFFLVDYYNSLPRKNRKKNKKIYLRRPSNSNRDLLNARQVEDIFKKYNYEIITPDNLTLQEKLDLFFCAKVVASMIGSGMANLIFAQNNIQVLEILPQYFRDSYNQVISTIKGCNYHYIVGESFDFSVHPLYEKTYVDPKNLVDALEKIEEK